MIESIRAEVQGSRVLQWFALTIVTTGIILVITILALAFFFTIQNSTDFIMFAIIIALIEFVVVGLLGRNQFSKLPTIIIESNTLHYFSAIHRFSVPLSQINSIERDELSGTWNIIVKDLKYLRRIPNYSEFIPILDNIKDTHFPSNSRTRE